MKNKPILLVPSILVYKTIAWIINAIVFFVRKIASGTVFVLKKTGLFIVTIIKYIGIYSYKLLMLILKGIKYVLLGIYTTFKMIGIFTYLIIKNIIMYIYKIIKYIFELLYKLIKYSFMGVYLLIKYVIKGIYTTLKYVIKGIYTTLKYIFKSIYVALKYIFNKIINFMKYTFKGFKTISYFVYLFVKYVFKGIAFIFILIPYIYNISVEYSFKAKKKRLRNNVLNNKIKEERQRVRLQYEIEKKERKADLKKTLLEAKKEAKIRKKKEKERNSYVNENVKIERKKLADYINDFLKVLMGIPKKIKEYFVRKYNSSAFVKNAKNKEEISRESLLINFEGDDAEKSDKKRVYEFVGKSPEGKLVKDTFEAFSKVEVHSFLLSEGYEVYSIKTSNWIQFLYGSSNISRFKMKSKDLIFFLAQLSTYLKAGITLVEALRILSHQYKKRQHQKMFKSLIYDLTMGDNFSEALEKRGNVFPKLLINMVKASEMTGSLPEALDDMEEYYTQSDKTRKQMITAMTYPAIIFVISIAVVTFIMVYVIPKFVNIYESIDPNSIPKFTLIVLGLSDFLKGNLIMIFIIAIIVILIFAYLYRNVQLFRSLIQWLLMHTPVVDNIIIYNEITMFTKTFASLLKHNVFITDSMEILNKMTTNEIFKMIILDTITNLAKGEKISLAFKDQWAVPLPAYEMIVTGERTGQLAEMMQKVSDYYQELHANAVGRLKTFMEPVLIIFLTGVVGVIVLSIVIPMFSLYSAIG
ncbi:MAG: type II secretion system F family protein [Bacilli bacterium]|nr:type II secretion system F family protein [Bacilli bacterium]MDD4733699.1 type II secretion system F family protein [Bacilli bacterium]